MFRSVGLDRHVKFIALMFTAATPALAVELSSPPGEHARTEISVGAEYTSGNYGRATDTNIWYVPLTLRHGNERWYARLTIPWLRVEGSGDVVISSGGAKGAGRKSGTSTSTTTRAESGIGDVIAAAGYRLLTQTEVRPSLDLTGKVYFATADEAKGLGTGENDYAAQLDLTKNAGDWILSGAGGYLVTGDPAGIDYKNVFYGWFDAGYRFDVLTIGAVINAQQAIISANDGPAYLTGYVTNRLAEDVRLTTYLLRGLSDASPDWGAGIVLTREF